VLYELRVYRTTPGRLPDLVKRFQTVTLQLWEKHGIRQVGFWTVMIGNSNRDLYYMLEWQDLADRERRWAAFMSDPEWLKARTEADRNGPIVENIANTMLAPTSFSRLK
jgi:hypothetical protein